MRLCLLITSFCAALLLVPAAAYPAPASLHQDRLLFDLRLPDGNRARVYQSGIAEVFAAGSSRPIVRMLPFVLRRTDVDQKQLEAYLAGPQNVPYLAGSVLIVFRPGISARQDLLELPPEAAQAVHAHALNAKSHMQSASVAYTNDSLTNEAFAQLGVDRVERLFRSLDRSTLSALHSGAQSAARVPLLDFSNAYRIHVTGTPARNAVQRLEQLPSVAYAELDWRVNTLHVTPVRIPPMAPSFAKFPQPLSPSSLPTNYVLTSSGQSLLNTPSTNAVVAFDEIQRRFNQLPGQGVRVTNVSIGDLDDQSANSPQNPCQDWVQRYGPTSEMIGNQRYLNFPAMPLIPSYVADASGNLSGSAQICGTGDPELVEIGLDFSMMAPLPANLQRPGESGILLGIAPGAQYSLVVPANPSPGISDIDAAFLGAALQNPRPNVITASLGFGEDAFGFSTRYLEDDPLTESIVASLVHEDNIVVCISAGDGLRDEYSNAAVNPSGGSTPTNVVQPGGTPTSLDDVAFSTVPSEDFDSGAIDAGASTLDDIFAVPPQFSQGQSEAQHAFAETRWTGVTGFSSGFGTRTNVSAPGDNVLSWIHLGAPDGGGVVINGGTSASAPEIAAASAIVLQVAKLTGHPQTAVDVRQFLEQTGTTLPRVPQSDVDIQVGPQVNVGEAVETLLQRAGQKPAPAVVRVGVEQRRFGDFSPFTLDTTFLSDTDPTNIDITGNNELAWITIAPDWEGTQQIVRYRLFVTGHPTAILATTPWARLLPDRILQAAGFTSSQPHTVSFTYEALHGMRPVASTTFSLTFTAGGLATVSGCSGAPGVGFGCGGPIITALAPQVSATASGPAIHIDYDLSKTPFASKPVLVISRPGRVNPATGSIFLPAITQPLVSKKGSIDVPVGKLYGGGVYGVTVEYTNPNDVYPVDSDFAYVRVAPAPVNRANPPILSGNGTKQVHNLEIPYGNTFSVQWDVSNVPGATGAMLEISAGGPSIFGNHNSIDNPNGSQRDNDGVDSSSVYFAPLPALRGTATFKGTDVDLIPTMEHLVRVLPMRDGKAAGEASDASMIVMDGVVTADGGSVGNGFGVNPNALDGFLTSNQVTASGKPMASVQTFDQTTNAIVATVASSSDILSTIGAGVYSSDTGVFSDFNPSTNATSYSVLSPLSQGVITSQWTPPLTAGLQLLGSANDLGSNNGVFLAANPTAVPSPVFDVFSSNVVTNSSSPFVNVIAALPPPPDQQFGGVWEVTGVGADKADGRAVLSVAEFQPVGGSYFPSCSPPLFVTVDIATGKVTSTKVLGTAAFYGAAFDSQTGVAALPSNRCKLEGLAIHDLRTGHNTITTLPGVYSVYPAVDPTHQLFFIQSLFGADGFGDLNNNALSTVTVLSESGQILQVLERFNFFSEAAIFDPNLPLNNYLAPSAGYAPLQVVPSRRTGYVPSRTLTQLEPFDY